jgi:ATP-dependent Clp protease protease subunit
MNYLKEFKPQCMYEAIYHEMLEKRTLYINDDISDVSIDTIAMPILIQNEIEKDIPVEELKPIWIYINSNGGDITSCAYIVEVIQNSRIPIYGVAMSMAASAALYILLSCHKRFGRKNSNFLLHKGYIKLDGNVSDAEDHLDFYKDVNTIFENLITTRTKITEKKLKEIRRNETLCLGIKARDEYGFIDEIL